MGFLTQAVLSRAGIRRDFLIKQLTQAKYSFELFIGEGEYLATDDHLAAHLTFEATHGKLIKIISGPMMHGKAAFDFFFPQRMKNIFLELHQQGRLWLFVRPTRGDHPYFLIIDGKYGWFMEKPRGLLKSLQGKSSLKKMTFKQVVTSSSFFTETLQNTLQANTKIPLLMPDGQMKKLGQWLARHHLDYNKLTAAEIADIENKLKKEEKLLAINQ